MESVSFDFIADFVADPANGWSIGSFGAIGEFVRDADEPADIRRSADTLEVVTARGGMRIAPTIDLTAVAWDSLSKDGESWGHALAFCCPKPVTPNRFIRALGADADALQPEHRDHQLFDLGVACGAVVMTLRTDDAPLIAALAALEGQAILANPSVMAEVLRAQPHRVLLSPAGRVEVYQPIPPADGKSPIGPHTHLLPKLIAKDRPHSANTPIPDGWQAALNLHPRSPWRTMLGERHDFKAEVDAAFTPILDRFSISEDRSVETALRRAIDAGAVPEFADWPDTRRGRTKARIVLRRMAAAGDDRVRAWRALHDRLPVEIEEGEEA